jgi:hypothetical protein
MGIKGIDILQDCREAAGGAKNGKRRRSDLAGSTTSVKRES